MTECSYSYIAPAEAVPSICLEMTWDIILRQIAQMLERNVPNVCVVTTHSTAISWSLVNFSQTQNKNSVQYSQHHSKVCKWSGWRTHKLTNKGESNFIRRHTSLISHQYAQKWWNRTDSSVCFLGLESPAVMLKLEKWVYTFYSACSLTPYPITINHL